MLEAHTFSRNEMNLIEKLIERSSFRALYQWQRDPEFDRLSAREKRDFLKTLGFEDEE